MKIEDRVVGIVLGLMAIGFVALGLMTFGMIASGPWFD